MVTLTGGAGAGKTTLADALAAVVVQAPCGYCRATITTSTLPSMGYDT